MPRHLPGGRPWSGLGTTTRLTFRGGCAPPRSAAMLGPIAPAMPGAFRRTRRAHGADGMGTEEQRRLEQAETGVRWRRWGPYLSERQWGTVREDPGHGENTWGAFPFDQAAYRA